MNQFHANYFIWVGDAVYTQNTKVESLKVALDTLLTNEHYMRFINHTKVYGTWDDHGTFL